MAVGRAAADGYEPPNTKGECPVKVQIGHSENGVITLTIIPDPPSADGTLSYEADMLSRMTLSHSNGQRSLVLHPDSRHRGLTIVSGPAEHLREAVDLGPKHLTITVGTSEDDLTAKHRHQAANNVAIAANTMALGATAGGCPVTALELLEIARLIAAAERLRGGDVVLERSRLEIPDPGVFIPGVSEDGLMTMVSAAHVRQHEAEAVVRALAASDPDVDVGYHAAVRVCGVCKKEEPEHDPGCAWRMAQEWVVKNPEDR